MRLQNFLKVGIKKTKTYLPNSKDNTLEKTKCVLLLREKTTISSKISVVSFENKTYQKAPIYDFLKSQGILPPITTSVKVRLRGLKDHGASLNNYRCQCHSHRKPSLYLALLSNPLNQESSIL